MSIFKAHTPVYKDIHGKHLKNSITEMQMVPLGNTKQSVIIRGEDRRNPVLLLVHGGPGSAETPLFRYYNSELEKNFVVVYWDQRGCGKSYIKRDANAPLNIQMFVQDLCDLAIYLERYLSKEKIYLLAHSWGTLLGILAVSQHPELFKAYVGTGQVASMPESELASYQFTLRSAKEQKNEKAIRELTAISEPQNGVYTSGITGIRTQRKWLNYFGGSIYGSKSIGTFISRYFTSPEYNFVDIVRFFKSLNTPARNKLSQGEFLKTDLLKTIKKVDIPVYFFLGRHDYQVASVVAEKFFHELIAPKKELIWFEQSAHSACFEEAKKFNSLMIDMVLSTTTS
jgi:Predicted hydrolases or acyltransferases (alpha/beta hydrolase superfamily)